MQGFGVWIRHLPALTAFLAVSGQWRTAGGGMGKIVWVGLDYAAARAGLDLAGVTVTPALWDDLRQIERGAMEELNSGR